MTHRRDADQRWNPLTREQDAFRLVIGIAVYFAAIAVAVVAGGSWAGVAVFLALTVIGVWILVRLVRGR